MQKTVGEEELILSKYENEKRLR